MFNSLVRNIAITGVAYAFISVVGLVLAPVLIGAYGLVGYGQILLARIFLPSAAFGFLDLGVGENTTRTIASARADQDWGRATRVITLLTALALGVAMVTGALLAIFAPLLAGWLSIAESERPGFIAILRITAALQPFLFLSLIAEGSLKGFEKFKQVRSCEVASALVFGALAVGAVIYGLGPNFVSLALLIGLTIRSLLAFIFAGPELIKHGVRLMRWNKTEWRETLGWSRTMMFNKILGTLQTQAASPLLGALVGPAAVGLFDAIVRLPRFVKSIFSLTSSTVLPLAARLRAGGDSASMTRLGDVGIIAAMAMFTPATALAMAFSESIITFWLGAKVAPYWYWQSLMFVVPILNVAISFGGTILLAEHVAARSLNRLAAMQVFLQLLLSLALLPWLNPWSFIVGQVVSVLLIFPAQLVLIHRKLEFGAGFIRRLALIAVSSAVFACLLRWLVPEPTLAELLALLGFGSAIATLGLPLMLLSRDGRSLVAERGREWLNRMRA